jgi:hypothetical protein
VTIKTLTANDEDRPEGETPEAEVAAVVTAMLARPVSLTLDLPDEPPPPLPFAVRLMRRLVAREIVDRLVIDDKQAAAKHTYWRAQVVSWTTHLLRWGVRPEDVRDLYDVFVDTFPGGHEPDVFDLRAALLELRRLRVDAARRREAELKAAGRTLTGAAETQCIRCLGTTYERMFDREGKARGVRAGCGHERVGQDRLWVYLQDKVALTFWQHMQGLTGGEEVAGAEV